MKKVTFWHTFKRDFREIHRFYFNPERRAILAKAGWFKKWYLSNWWFFKTVITKLTPLRRSLFFAGWILFAAGHGSYFGSTVYMKLSFFVLFFIIILELKDKFLAKDELAAGSAIQSALMPGEDPAFAGWDIWLFNSPAREVGGDLIDFVRIDRNKLGLALGDVSGKGLGAALLMARLQASLAALIPVSGSLTELGWRLNRIFCRDCLPGKFASFVYIEIQSESGDLTLLNAGHLPPILIRNGALEEMPKGQTALGLSDSSVYEEQSAHLAPGEILLACSDGITEAGNEDGDLYGEERLHDLCFTLQEYSASEIGNRILSEIREFIGTARQSDDVSLIVLKRLSSTFSG